MPETSNVSSSSFSNMLGSTSKRGKRRQHPQGRYGQVEGAARPPAAKPICARHADTPPGLSAEPNMRRLPYEKLAALAPAKPETTASPSRVAMSQNTSYEPGRTEKGPEKTSQHEGRGGSRRERHRVADGNQKPMKDRSMREICGL